MRRQYEIERELDRIQQDPNLKGEAALNAIRQVNPEFASALDGYVQGRFRVPNASRYQTLVNRIIGLGAKVDPTFNAQTYDKRAWIAKDITSGQDGRTLTSIATADDHVQELKRAIEEVRRNATIGGPLRGSDYANAIYQAYIKHAPDLAPGASVDAKHAVNAYNYLVHLVAPEIARAQKGSAPTLEEINHAEGALSSTQDPDGLLLYLSGAEDLFHQRFNEIRQRFVSMSGGHPDSDMMNLFRRYERRGFAFDQPPQGSGGVDPGLYPPGLGKSYGDARGDFMNRPWRPSTPVSPAPGRQGQSSPQSDDDAIKWARAHPDDPRAKQILQLNGL